MQGTEPAALALRDIHFPAPISWWPPAPGWWILLLLMVVTGSLIVFCIQRYHNFRSSAVYLAKQELERIKNEFVLNQDKSNLVKELSELIRRLSISFFKRDKTASLTGKEWLEFLDQYTENKLFSNGIGRIFIEAPYQAKPDYDSADLISLTSSWIDSVSSSKRNRK